MSWAVVVPTNRPEKFKEFYAAWQHLFRKHKVRLVIVEDGKEYSDLGEIENYAHLNWGDVPDYIPRKTDMIRSWGFWFVYDNKLADYVLTLDDDVLPSGDPFEEYEEAFTGSVLSPYLSVGGLTDSGLQMRGFPYKDRKITKVAVQYGGWHGVLDYDAATQLAFPTDKHNFHPIVMPVPKGTPATCCIMNCAFRVEYTPIMWQLTMVNGRFNRIGDIWSGLFIKKTLDALGEVMLINGRASVIHDRASDPYASLVKEAPSVWLNDNLWEKLIHPVTQDMMLAYRQITHSAYSFFYDNDMPYAEKFKEDRDLWLKLFK